MPSDIDRLQGIYAEIHEKCKFSTDEDRKVTFDDIKEALRYIKSRKADGDKGLISDHLLLASDIFLQQLALMLTSILTHGYQPKDILLGTITSIPKDSRGNICSGKNYRGITMCNSISKLIDILFIIRYSEQLQTSDMQYAFKKKHSTVMCNLVLKEVLSHYLNNQSQVYACFIDATKAFDRLRHDKLFELLLKRKIPAIALRALLDLYQRQMLRTVWKGHYSRLFSATNGIRQGGVISPVLFCVYIDELLKRLEREGHGCWVGNHFYGAFSYADDMKILCPSVKGLRKMMKICEEFGKEYGVEYNPTKTVCIRFSKKEGPTPEIHLSGTPFKWVKSQ